MMFVKKSERGSITFTVGFVMLLIGVLFTFFTIIVFKNNVNLVLHNLKNDLYLISRNSIFSIKRDLMSEDVEELDEYELKRCISGEIREVWNLDRNLNNGTGIIKEADILELEVLNTEDKDSVNNKMIGALTVHIVIGVHVKPIILNSIFDDIFYFKLHEDLKINKLET